MIGTYRTQVEALRLASDTIEELIRWTGGSRLGPDRWDPAEHCWHIAGHRWWPAIPGAPYLFHDARTLLVGISTRNGDEVLYEGDYVVQDGSGGFEIVAADRFRKQYVGGAYAGGPEGTTG